MVALIQADSALANKAGMSEMSHLSSAAPLLPQHLAAHLRKDVLIQLRQTESTPNDTSTL